MLIGTCMTPECGNPCAPALKRGLCMKCYIKAKKLVGSGTATWNELAEMKLCLPDDYDDSFIKEFNKRSSGDASNKQTDTP